MKKTKVIPISKLKKIVSSQKKIGKTVVFTNGCFDILHKGHLKLFEKAKSLGDTLIVAINSDSSVRKIKGQKRPINSAKDRAAVLSAITFVDYVTTFSETNPGRAIEKLKPDVLVKGGDWKMGEIIGRAFVESGGGKVYVVPLAKGYSTSSIINKIAKGLK